MAEAHKLVSARTIVSTRGQRQPMKNCQWCPIRRSAVWRLIELEYLPEFDLGTDMAPASGVRMENGRWSPTTGFALVLQLPFHGRQIPAKNFSGRLSSFPSLPQFANHKY